jgi:hypothetical protein
MLIVLLLLTGISGLLFTVSQLSTSSNRQTSSASRSSEARLQAEAGIDEGLTQLKLGLLDARGEWGALTTTAGPYELAPLVRGYGSPVGAPCSVFTTSLATLDPACPYYTVAVRRMVAADQPGEPLLGKIDLRDWDNLGQTTFTFGYFASQLPAKQNLNFTSGTITCTTGCAADSAGVDAPQTYVSATDFAWGTNYSGAPQVPNAARGTLTLQVPLATDIQEPTLSLAADAPGGQVGSQLYQRETTYIVATGYSGDTRSTLIAAYIKGNLLRKPVLVDFLGEVSSKGYIYQ